MAITSLASLKEKALSYFKDRTDLEPFIQDGVDLATDYFSQRLRVREMVSSTFVIPDADGVCELPDDFIELISVVEAISYGTPLDQMTDVGAGTAYYSGAAGVACNYVLFNDTIKVYPVSANNVNIIYYAKIPPLQEGGPHDTSNWLLQKFPNLYLDYCRMFAADIAEDPNEAKYGAKVDAFIDLLNERNQTAMYARVTTDLSGEVVVP